MSWEEHWPGADGDSHRHWLCYYQPVFGPDGVLRMVMCYGLDITTRRQAEARTRESEAAVAGPAGLYQPGARPQPQPDLGARRRRQCRV